MPASRGVLWQGVPEVSCHCQGRSAVGSMSLCVTAWQRKGKVRLLPHGAACCALLLSGCVTTGLLWVCVPWALLGDVQGVCGACRVQTLQHEVWQSHTTCTMGCPALHRSPNTRCSAKYIFLARMTPSCALCILPTTRSHTTWCEYMRQLVTIITDRSTNRDVYN